MTVAALVLAGITLALLIATTALLARTRTELDALRRQLAEGHRPILVDVLPNAPVPPDMDPEAPFPELAPRPFDPRAVFVAFEREKVYVSVPLRNVGGGLAVIDASGVSLTGPPVGDLEYRSVQREHIPANETTRVDLIAAHRSRQAPDPADRGSATAGITWQLTVPYADYAGERRAVSQLQIVCRGEDLTGPWLVDRVDQGAPGRAHAPHQDDLADRRPSERPDARPQRGGLRDEPVVDLWGNPVVPKRGRR